MGTIKYVLFCVFVARALAQDDSDKLWIMFDNANLFECSGVQNQYTIDKNDIHITDKDGNPAYFMECPNEYTIEFRNMKPKKALPNLSGDIAATIQVPLVQGPAGLSFDFPYSCIPQKHLLAASTCDNSSGVINDATEKREYCRYCDICESAGYVENGAVDKLTKHQYVGSVDPNDKFSKVCTKIDATQTYNLKRKTNCPGKKELENEANQSVKPGLDSNLEKKLKVGKGKLQVFLSLMSSDKDSLDANTWYANKKGCECCAKDQAGSSNCKANFFGSWASNVAGSAFVGSGNPCLNCNNEYARGCVQGSASKVGCYRVEYNFRVTDKRADFEEFKQQIQYNQKVKNGLNPWQSSAGTQTNANTNTGGSANINTNTNTNTNTNGGADKGKEFNRGGGSPNNGSGPQSCNKCSKDNCLGSITFPPTKSYCGNWWTTPSAHGYCCSKCPTACTP